MNDYRRLAEIKNGEILSNLEVNEKISYYKFPYLIINAFLLFFMQAIGWLACYILDILAVKYQNEYAKFLRDKAFISLPLFIFIITV